MRPSIRIGVHATTILCILSLCLVLPVTAGSTSSVAVGASSPTAVDAAVPGVDVDPDDILLAVSLRPDGGAGWTVEYRVRLHDAAAIEAFETLSAEIESDPGSFESSFESRMVETASNAAIVTGRDMTIENVSISTTIRHLPQQYGIIVYEFEWVGFATFDEAHIQAGDAIEGLFLDDRSRLLVGWPSGYMLSSVAPEPPEVRESSVIWHGPIDFGAGEPHLVVTGDGITHTPSDDDAVGISPHPFLAPLGALILVSAAIWWLVSGRHVFGRTIGDGPSSDSGGIESTKSGSSPALLSNEERVITLLEDRGGRIKQQEVVTALGWTDAKTSQVVRRMHEEGTITVFRLGRENIISLPKDDTI